MRLESSIERSVVVWAKQRGIRSTKLQGMGNRSMPDRIFWVPGGRPVLIEFKREDGKLTALQQEAQAYFKRIGYDVHVCYSVAEAKAALTERMQQ